LAESAQNLSQVETRTDALTRNDSLFWKPAFQRQLATRRVRFSHTICNDSPRHFPEKSCISRSVPEKSDVPRRHGSETLNEAVQDNVDRSQAGACSVGDLVRRFQFF
jgi:hypothetical protein